MGQKNVSADTCFFEHRHETFILLETLVPRLRFTHFAPFLQIPSLTHGKQKLDSKRIRSILVNSKPKNLSQIKNMIESVRICGYTFF